MISSKQWRYAALVAVLLAMPVVHGAEVAGVKVDERVPIGTGELLLNGAGLRSKLFIKVYVGALYVSQKATTAAAIVDGMQPRRMVLRMLRDVDAEALHEALDEGLKNNHTPGELAAMKPSAEQLSRIMKGIGKVREGDTIALDFSGDEVALSLNGQARGKVVAAGFPKAMLKVWLGEQPVDASLKKALLGS